MAAIAKQPVSIAIEADKFVSQSYVSGVLDFYWLVNKPWDTVWGDEAYIKIARIEGQVICGIQIASVYPTCN